MTRTRQLLASLAIYLVASSVPWPVLAEERGWSVVQNSHFRALTNATHVEAIELLRGLEEFRLAALAVASMHIPEGAAGRTNVVLFSTLDQLRQYAPSKTHVGYLLSLVSGPVIVMSAEPGQSDGLSSSYVIRHEYVHALASFQAFRYPCWYGEGLAEVLATLKVEDGYVLIGQPAKARLIGLFDRPLTDEDIDSCIHGVPDRYGKFWLLTHYLVFDGTRRDELNEYLRLFNSGIGTLDAFKTAFGLMPNQMWESELAQHRQIQTYRIRLDKPVVDASFTVEPAEAEEASKTLALLEAWNERVPVVQQEDWEGKSPELRERVYKNLAKAQECFSAKDYSCSMKYLDKAKKLKRLSVFEQTMIYSFYGSVFSAQNQFTDSAEAFEVVLNQPGLPLALRQQTVLSVAGAYKKLGDWNNLIKVFDEWCSFVTRPGPTPYINMASAYRELGNYPKEIWALEKAIAIARSREQPVETDWEDSLRNAYQAQADSELATEDAGGL